MLLNSHCNSIDGEVEVEWERHDPVQTMPWKLSSITGINLSGYLSHSPFVLVCEFRYWELALNKRLAGQDAAWAGCEPQDFDVGCKTEQENCWLKKTAPWAIFAEAFQLCSSEPRCASFTWPCVCAQGWGQPSSAAELGSAGGEPPCAAAGQRLRGVRRVKLNYWR